MKKRDIKEMICNKRNIYKEAFCSCISTFVSFYLPIK